jgi:hypothetical protein
MGNVEKGKSKDEKPLKNNNLTRAEQESNDDKINKRWYMNLKEASNDYPMV